MLLHRYRLLIEIHIHVLRQCVSYYLKVPLNLKKFMFDNVPFLNAKTMKALIVVLFFVVPHTDTVNTGFKVSWSSSHLLLQSTLSIVPSS